MTTWKNLTALALGALVTFGSSGGCNCNGAGGGGGGGGGEGEGEGECRTGTLDCPCDGERCDTGLVCTTGTCREPEEAGIRVLDASARSCEVLLVETGGKVLGVTFSSAVTGRFIREGNKVAVAFHANGDARIENGAVEIGFSGAGTVTDALQLTQPRCFDGTGAALAGPGLEL